MNIDTGENISIRHFCLSLLPIILLIISGAAFAGDDSEAFPEVKGKFPSKSHSYSVDGEIIDYCGKVQVILDKGTLYKRRDKDCYDFYFLGSGRIQIIDTAGLEANWRHSFGDKRILEFTDTYICGNNFEKYLMLDPGKWKDDKIDREHWQILRFMVGAPERYFWVNLSGELGLRPDQDILSPPIWMHFKLVDKKNVVFYIAPDFKEQLNIYHTNLDFQQPYLAAGYRVNDCLKMPPVEFDSTVIAINLMDHGKFEAICDLYIPPGSDRRGMNLSLPTWFKVDSIMDGNGQSIPFIKKTTRNYLYMGPRHESMDESDQITIYYRGKLMKTNLKGNDFPAHLTNWFPRLPRWNLGYFTVRYTLHKDLMLISPGIMIDEQVDGDIRKVTYTTGNKAFTSFAYGVYDTLIDTVAGVPMTLYIRKENTGGLFKRKVPDKFLDGLSDAFDAYCEWYGPPSAKSIRVVDQPNFLAQSSPGLIHFTFVNHLPARYQPRIRAHEMAHQWWGNTVGTESFRDVWMAEGIAEYSSAMYILRILADTADYQDQINEWRRDILEEGKINGQFSRGYKAGPITMGTNLFKSKSPGDYWSMVYYKAAYMMEMLRFEIDGPEFRTNFFDALLADLNREYFEVQASSLDFIRIAARYIGEKRAVTFFSQWLFGWKVPDFKCEYSIVPDKKGRPMLHIGIEVSGVEDGFATPYPIEIEFEDGSKRLFRIDGIGRKRDHMLGPFPEKIKKVRFDPNHIILSRDTEVKKIS